MTTRKREEETVLSELGAREGGREGGRVGIS